MNMCVSGLLVKMKDSPILCTIHNEYGRRMLRIRKQTFVLIIKEVLNNNKLESAFILEMSSFYYSNVAYQIQFIIN